MPSNSVEDRALKLARFKQGATESVSDYALRFRAVTNHFESAVERQTQGRTPCAAFSVTLFQHGLIPSIPCPNCPVSRSLYYVKLSTAHVATKPPASLGALSAPCHSPLSPTVLLSHSSITTPETLSVYRARPPRQEVARANPGKTKPGGGSCGGSGSSTRADRPECGYPG